MSGNIKKVKITSAHNITEAEMDLRKLMRLHMERGEWEIAKMIRDLLNIKVQKDFQPRTVK